MRTFEQNFQSLPPPAAFGPADVIERLDGDLVLRRATEADIDALCAFHQAGLADPPDYEPSPHLAAWTPELMDGRHPRMRARDFLLVEDTGKRRIASTVCLIPLRLRYDGVELDAGQPELVATHPEYRRRGLVRAQFEVVHRWSQERGQQLQLIDGIPWFYRQLGYEMGIESEAGRVVHPRRLRRDPPPEGLCVRPVAEPDLPFLSRLYERVGERDLLFCRREASDWLYELRERAPLSYARRELRIVERDGDPVAAFAHYPVLLLGGMLLVSFFEVEAGVSWASVAPTVLHALGEAGTALGDRYGGGPLTAVCLVLGSEHPAYRVLSGTASEPRPAYAYYVRVPDLRGFLERVAPALALHLDASPLAGHSGSLALSMYRSGVRLELRGGRVAGVESWLPTTESPGDVAFPDRTFLQLLFGYRSLAELSAAFPDCRARNDTGAALVEALFPKRSSNLWPTC